MFFTFKNGNAYTHYISREPFQVPMLSVYVLMY